VPDPDPGDTFQPESGLADTDTGGPLVDTYDTDAGGWSHTIAVDGDPADWYLEETLPADSGATLWVTWNSSDIYVAYRHLDVRTGGPQHWVVLTLGGDAGGANYGAILGTQTPSVPFGASTILRFKADASYHDLQLWDGGAWMTIPEPFGGLPNDYLAERNDLGVIEARFDRFLVGALTTLDVHANMVFEAPGFESSWGASPPGSFPQGSYDPNYTKWWSFDLSGTPADVTLLP
jgi:hypothetical protein